MPWRTRCWPADRWQSAGELAARLEAVLTPSGGLTPTTPTPAVSSGTRAAIRLSQPGRVVALFAAASAVILGVVWLLVHRLGLPDWVLYGAVALLLVGLPIVLVASAHERRRAVAKTAGLPASTPPGGLAPWLSWRRALVGGGLAFAGLATVAAVYTGMRLLGIGPVGTLVASGVLEEREKVLLADFENRSPDSTLGASLTEAFRVDLSQSPTIRLLDPQEVADALRRMQRPSGVTVAPAYKRLGELYEARQDRRKAADYYGRFVDLYQHADPQLQPGVREVRERLARLAQEPGS